jgi:hypothetical protein
VQANVINPTDVLEWLRDQNIRVLDVTGNRESINPGIGERVEAFLSRVFAQLRESDLT